MKDKYIKTRNIKWNEIEKDVFEKLCIDDTVGIKVSILRIEPHKEILMHKHTDTRYNFILKGSMSDGNRECGEGDILINEKGSEHFLKSGPSGCEFILIWN